MSDCGEKCGFVPSEPAVHTGARDLTAEHDLWHQLQAAEGARRLAEQERGNLLAVIHRDGGHYISEHGLEKAQADAEAMVLAERNANRTRPDYNLRCQECGAAHNLDTSIPSKIWNVIAPDVSILCTLCIDERMAAKGLTAEAEFYFVGKALKSKLYAESQGDVERQEREVERLQGESAGLRDKMRVTIDTLKKERVELAGLRKAGELTVLHFQRSNASGNFQCDDEHEAWTALTRALAPQEGAPEKGKVG